MGGSILVLSLLTLGASANVPTMAPHREAFSRAPTPLTTPLLTHGPTMRPHFEVWRPAPTPPPHTTARPTPRPSKHMPFEQTREVRSDTRCRVVLLRGPKTADAAVRGCFGEFVVRDAVEPMDAADNALSEREIAGHPTYRWRGGVDGPAREGPPCPGVARPILFFCPRLRAWAVGRPGRLLRRTGVPQVLALVARGSHAARTPDTYTGAWQGAYGGTLRQKEHLAGRGSADSEASSWAHVPMTLLPGVRASCKFFSSTAPSPVPTPPAATSATAAATTTATTTNTTTNTAAATNTAAIAAATSSTTRSPHTRSPTPATTHILQAAARPTAAQSRIWGMPTWRPAKATAIAAPVAVRRGLPLAQRLAPGMLVVAAFAVATECIMLFARQQRAQHARVAAGYVSVEGAVRVREHVVSGGGSAAGAAALDDDEDDV